MAYLILSTFNDPETRSLQWLAITSSSLTVTVETIIAAVLCAYLHKRRHTGMMR